MVGQKSHFLSYRFPNAGQFYADPECTRPLFIGQLEIVDNDIYIKVLSEQEHYYRYPDTLYALLNTLHEPQNLVAYSFFGCLTGNPPSVNNYIQFRSFIRHDNGNRRGWSNDDGPKDNGVPLPAFVTEQSFFKRIVLRINKLDEWLWKLGFDEKSADRNLKKPNFSARYVDNKDRYHTGYRTFKGYIRSINKMIIPFKSLVKKIKIDDNTTIVFRSEPEAIGSEFPNFSVSQDSTIEIISSEPKTIEWFIKVIYKLKTFLSIITSSECKIYSISYHEPTKHVKGTKKYKPYKHIDFFYNSIGWYLNTKPIEDWFVGYHLLYRNIRADLDTSLKLFFNKYTDISMVAHFLLNAEHKRETESFDLYLADQLQVVEMYGNLKNRGAQTSNDIKTVISDVPDNIFDNVFIHYYDTRNSIPCVEIFGRFSDSKAVDTNEVQEYRKILLNNLIDIRNFIIHPYKKGQLKVPKNEIKFEYWRSPDGQHLNWKALSQLSVSLNKMLRYFVLKEIGLDKFWHI